MKMNELKIRMKIEKLQQKLNEIEESKKELSEMFKINGGYNFIIYDWMRKNKKLTASALTTYAIIYKETKDNGSLKCTITSLSEQIGLARPYVGRILDYLQENGFISINKLHGWNLKLVAIKDEEK